MISIEKDEYVASRANFNKPYACVQVKHGDSEIVLPRLQLEEKQLLVWLDYDKSIDGPVFKDLSTLCQNALTGSLLIVTVNANKNSLPKNDAHGNNFADINEALRYFAGDLIPQSLPADVLWPSKYPIFLASLLFKHMRHQVYVAGRSNDVVVPIFNIRYQDNAPMLTVGAVIADHSYAKRINKVLKAQRVTGQMSEKEQLFIRVPPLTQKEKATIDQLMPCDPAPTESAVKDLGFRLRQKQIEAYHRFYRYYPMFGEVMI